MKKILITGSYRQIQHIKLAFENKCKVFEVTRNKYNNFFVRQFIKLFLIFVCDVYYAVFPDVPDLFWSKICKFFNKKVVFHWIGSDVFKLKNNKFLSLKYKRAADFHFSCFYEIKNDLLSVGIYSEDLPITPFSIDLTLSKMPSIHSAIYYCPTGREEHYGLPFIEKLFVKFSNLHFYIVENDNYNYFSKYSNVTVKGHLSLPEMKKLYDKISIVIRYPKHDGLSMSVLEGLYMGKYVIWNYHHKYVYYARDYNELCYQLQMILDFSPSINIDEHNYVFNLYTKENYFTVFSEYVKL